MPHSPYYGTHDAPALYCLALWQAWRWSGDRGPLERHLPAAEAALSWCDAYGDLDGDGLLEYQTRSSKGYRNQGWKDAGDAIVHAEGRLAEPPLATVELQGYWFAAQLAIAEILEALGRNADADHLRERASSLQRLVEERFWMEEEGTYALALDGQKRQVRSISSNPGHLLWCGLPSAQRANAVAERLMREDMWSGWGIRTLSAQHSAYNAISYQNGSVWPHDSALAAAGFLRYGLRDRFGEVAKGLLDAAAAFPSCRLPELFGGVARADGLPVPYREANCPQVWAAAVPVLIAQLLLGLAPDAPNDRCYVSPWLP
jgi:glycogen debranching enzyme